MSPISAATDAAPLGETRQIDGLAVTLHGQAGAPPVILSPGLGGLGLYWKYQIAALAEHYLVIRYDHRGTGASERTLSTPYGSLDLARDIELIIDGLGLPAAHVIGHAAGAVAGLALAQWSPQKLLSLSLINGWAKADRHFIRCFEIRMAIYQQGGAHAYLRAQPLFLYPAEWISDHLDALDAEAAHHAGNFQSEPVLRARIHALQSFDIMSRLAHIHCPTLLLASRDDMLVPSRCSVAMAEHLPEARLVMLDWGGHAVNVTDPDRVNRHLLEFLASFRPNSDRTGS